MVKRIELMQINKIVTFYHTYGYKKDRIWIVPMRVWVHENPNIMRRSAAKVVREVLEEKIGMNELSKQEKDLFMARTKEFVADSESNEKVIIKFDVDPEGKEYHVTGKNGKSKTDRNGRIEGLIKLKLKTVHDLLLSQNAQQGLLRFQAVSKDQMGIGFVTIISPKGLSVISDIDDTIKSTQILEGESLVLKNTFFRPYTSVPCMAEMYKSFGEETAFHYVSGCPWQMYSNLYEFLFSESEDFPKGSFHMKNLRTNPFESESYKDFWTLIANGSQQATVDQKLEQIRTLLTHFPGRKFILIGDSGEKDPEVYKQIRNEFPSQIEEIRIRMVVYDKDKIDRLDRMTQIFPNKEKQINCREFLKAIGTTPQ